MSIAVKLTNELLKSMMTDALAYRGIAQDLNACLEPGYYQVQEQSTQNIPTGIYSYGIVTVKRTATFLTQEYVPHNKSSTATKYQTASRAYTQGYFTPWRILEWD